MGAGVVRDWVGIPPGKSSRVHVATQRTGLGILSFQFRGRGGVVGGTAPGWGSDSPLSHQGAPLLFQCFNVFQMVRCWLRWSEAVLVAEGTPVPGPISNPFLQETLNRDHAPPRFGCPISSGTVVLSRLVLPPPAPGVSPEPGGPGCLRSLLGTDDVAGPGLVFGARRQVGDDHLHGLQLLVLGRDGAHLVGDLVAFHGDVLPLHAVGRGKTFRADAGRSQTPALGQELRPPSHQAEPPEPSVVTEGPLTQSAPFPGPRLRRWSPAPRDALRAVTRGHLGTYGWKSQERQSPA